MTANAPDPRRPRASTRRTESTRCRRARARRPRRRDRRGAHARRRARGRSTRGLRRRAGLRRPARAPARAGLRTQGDDRDAGREAALRGGFTTVCAMPNTSPAPDSAHVLSSRCWSAIARDARVRVLPIGCVTRGRAGKELAELAELAAAGCVALQRRRQPGGRRAADAARARTRRRASACRFRPLRGPGADARRRDARRLGSERLGLAGQPAAAEIAAIARNIALAEATGAHLHIAHVTTARGVELVADAKARGRAGHLRGDAQPPVPDRGCGVRRRAGAGLRHEREGQPAAAHRSGPAGARSRPERGHDRRHRHGPRAARHRRQALRVRRRGVRHQLLRDGARDAADARWSAANSTWRAVIGR